MEAVVKNNEYEFLMDLPIELDVGAIQEIAPEYNKIIKLVQDEINKAVDGIPIAKAASLSV